MPNSISAVLTFNSVSQGPVSYTNSGLAAGDTLRFALQADATSLATGYYNWSMAVTADYGGGNTSTTTNTVCSAYMITGPASCRTADKSLVARAIKSPVRCS